MGAKEGGPALVEQRGVAGCNQRRRSHPLLMRGGMRAGAKGRGGYACAHSIRRQRLEAHLVHAIDSVIAHRSRLWRTCRPASLSSRHHCRDADGRGVVGNPQRPAPSSSALRRWSPPFKDKVRGRPVRLSTARSHNHINSWLADRDGKERPARRCRAGQWRTPGVPV